MPALGWYETNGWQSYRLPPVFTGYMLRKWPCRRLSWTPDFGSAGKNSEPPSTLLFYTLVTCGFVAKKVGLVGGSQFFTALPKTAVSQYEKRLHNSGLMDKCGRSSNITVRLWNLSPTSRSHMV